jgi:gluconolactonase
MRNWASAILLPTLLTLVSAPALSKETVVVENVLGPEGPLVVDDNLYYVSWTPGSLSRWDGKTTKLLNNVAGCSHNGLALTKQKTFLLACTDMRGAILELDLNGKELRRWDADNRGRGFEGGINDIVVAANGGAYATIFGPFAETATAISGRLIYMAPGSGVWVEVADDLNYANGVAISPDQKTLYVGEMVGNAIRKFTIEADGTLSHRSNFVMLNLLVPNKTEKWWNGPDGFKTDSKGNLYVAQFYGGRVLKISPEGKLLLVFEILAGNGPTNVAFSKDENDIYVSVVTNADDAMGEAKGSIVKIANVR